MTQRGRLAKIPRRWTELSRQRGCKNHITTDGRGKKINDLDWLYLTNSSTAEMLLSLKDLSALLADNVDDRREEAEGALRPNCWVIRPSCEDFGGLRLRHSVILFYWVWGEEIKAHFFFIIIIAQHLRKDLRMGIARPSLNKTWLTPWQCQSRAPVCSIHSTIWDTEIWFMPDSRGWIASSHGGLGLEAKNK